MLQIGDPAKGRRRVAREQLRFLTVKTMIAAVIRKLSLTMILTVIKRLLLKFLIIMLTCKYNFSIIFINGTAIY